MFMLHTKSYGSARNDKYMCIFSGPYSINCYHKINSTSGQLTGCRFFLWQSQRQKIFLTKLSEFTRFFLMVTRFCNWALMYRKGLYQLITLTDVLKSMNYLRIHCNWKLKTISIILYQQLIQTGAEQPPPPPRNFERLRFCFVFVSESFKIRLR